MGQVIEIDSFGNLITNITVDMIAGHPTDRRACIVCNIYETWGVYHAYAEQPSGTLVAGLRAALIAASPSEASPLEDLADL